MKKDLIERALMLYARMFGKPLFEGMNKFLLQCGMRGLGCMNWQTDYLSGEVAFARNMLKRSDQPSAVVIDVRANEGDFVQAVLDWTENITIVGIEPHPKTFQRLISRFSGNNRVLLHQCCVGNKSGTATLFDHSSHAGSEQASLLEEAIDEKLFGPTSRIEVEMTRLDDLSFSVSAPVALLKIDVEGYELEVLKGGVRTIQEHAIPIVLLEFNEMNVASRTFFQDLRKLLVDYLPSRILPGGRLLPLKGCGPWKEEIFAYQNVAFIRKDR